jgi:hypothetical protein
LGFCRTGFDKRREQQDSQNSYRQKPHHRQCPEQVALLWAGILDKRVAVIQHTRIQHTQCYTKQYEPSWVLECKGVVQRNLARLLESPKFNGFNGEIGGVIVLTEILT